MTAIWSNDAEQSVLGGILLDQRAYDAALPLKADDFWHPAHAAVWTAIDALQAARKMIDPITVADQLGAERENVGGLVFVNALASSVPSASGVRRYAEIVRERAARRALVDMAHDAIELAQGDEALPEVLNAVGQSMSALQLGQVRKAPRRLADVAMQRTEHYEALQSGSVTPGWRTGLPWLDRSLNGGLRPGKLYFIAARPSVGKTSLSVQILLSMASDGLPGLMLSQEMSAEEVADRSVSHLGRIDYAALQTGKMNDDDWSRAADMLDGLRDLPVWIDDQGALTLGDIRAKVRSVQGVRVLLVDYLQLCSGSKRAGNRNSEIEEISRGLKALSMELGLAVIVLSQLNREVESRPGKRPQLSDLRDSGSIEQDADVVLFLWPLRDLECGGRLVGLAAEKNRQGKRGDVALDFRGDVQRWAESTEPVRSQDAGKPAERGFRV